MRIRARIVAIFAHPDDAEIWVGGTLYQHGQRGDSVEVYSVTYAVDSPRGQEGAEGAERLGVAFTCLGLTDIAVQHYTPDDAARLAALLVAQPPQIVLAHWQDDTPPDHAACTRLVTDALLHYAVSLGLDDVSASRRAFPLVWSCDTYGALGR